MPLTPIPGFVGGSYNSRARGASACRTVNMRVERNQDPNSKSPATFFTRSGKKLFATLPPGPIMGAWSNKTRTFWVSGGEVYELMEDGSNVHFGTVAIGSNPATMRANGNQLLICSAGNVYLFTGTSFYQPLIAIASGTISAIGTQVTWASGDKFKGSGGDIQVGDIFMSGSSVFTVAQVTDETHLVLDQDAGSLNNAPYQVGQDRLQGVMPEFIDGYFIVNVPNSKTFRISALFDGGTWNELDKGVKSGTTDNIAAIINAGGQLGLVGDRDSSEIWGDSGNQDFPFERISGRNLNCGTAAAWSVAKMTDGSVIWLMSSSAGEGQIVRSQGGEPTRISDHALENAIRGYGLVYDAIASTYIEGGHEFYRIDFPTANRTWEWDKTSNVWVELGVSTPQDEVYGADAGRFRVHVTWPSGRRADLVGDYASGKIWEVSPDFVDDDGVRFPVMRIAPHINTNLEPMNCPEFALDCELGTIDPTLKGPDNKPLIPTVSLAYSDDGARTWSEAGAASLGRSGEYVGTFLTEAERYDMTPGSQTNPQMFEPIPRWPNLGAFLISRTYKLKSTGTEMRAIYNGLAGISK